MCLNRGEYSVSSGLAELKYIRKSFYLPLATNDEFILVEYGVPL